MRQFAQIWEPNKKQRAKLNGACALHAGLLRLQTHTHTLAILLFHGNNGQANAP